MEFIYDHHDGSLPVVLTSRTAQDTRAAVANAAATGSVGATYNDVKVSRLYTSTGGINATVTPTHYWLVQVPS